MLKLTYGGTLV